MQQIIVQKPEIKLVGITARTNNAAEMDPSKAKIGATIQKYRDNGFSEKIENRKNPEITLCVYTNYESDLMGDYTYFIGQEVTFFGQLVDGLEQLEIPAQTYIKFTSELGTMPAVCINMWQEIWKMNSADLGGDRAYIADFELYDARAQDDQQIVLDIYIGIR